MSTIREVARPAVCILGGSGFLGRTLAARLATDGCAVRILTRDRERHRAELILLPTLQLIEADVFDPAVLRQHFQGCDAVVNLIGILNESRRASFQRVHVELTETAARAAHASGVRHFIYVSALHANTARAPSYYLRSKGEAEARVNAVANATLHYSILRPSVIFGPGDSFLNRFATLLRLSPPPAFPLACAAARFAPVYSGDVAAVITRILCAPDSYGQRYDLCGPQQYTLLQLVRYTAACANIRRYIIPLGPTLSRLQAMVCQYLPGKPFTPDNYRSTLVDSVCHGDSGLQQLGITPTPLEAIAPTYLSRNSSRRAQLYRYRQQAGRTSPP